MWKALLSIQNETNSILNSKTEALAYGCSQGEENTQTCPPSAWLAGGATQVLQALRKHFVFVWRQRRFRSLRICDEAGTQLQFEPFHLVVMQVFLNQVSFSLDARLHI